MSILKNFMVITGVFALLTGVSADAFDGAILKGIEIGSQDGHNYKIVVKTSRDVPVKKYITAADKIVLELENIKPAQYVNTVYQNATGIDHVIVQPSSGDKLRIFLQGLDIAAGKVILDTRDEVLSALETPTVSKPTTTVDDSIIIDLSDKPQKPVNSINKVKSVVTPDISGSQTDVFDWALRILAGIIIIIAGFKFLKKPKNVEVKLSSEKPEENELLKSMERRRELLTKSLGTAPAPKKTAPPAYNHYGLKEYRNSQLPPKPSSKSAMKMQEQKKTTASKITQKQTQQAKESFNKTKFLETMASIYQKSGRDDLATGIYSMIKEEK